MKEVAIGGVKYEKTQKGSTPGRGKSKDTCIIVSVSFLIAESKHLSRRNLGRLRFEGEPMVAGSEGSS